jgi:hypothetical protein
MSSTDEAYTFSEDAMLINHNSTWMSVRIAVLTQIRGCEKWLG